MFGIVGSARSLARDFARVGGAVGITFRRARRTLTTSKASEVRANVVPTTHRGRLW